MIKELLTALVLISPSLGFACGSGAAGSQGLVAQIEAKFGLVAENVVFKCGGESVSFKYKPPENLVPKSSYFSRWNKEFTLGLVEGEADLQAMLAMTPEQMKALIMANVYFHQDAYESQNRYGVHVYHPNGYPLARRVTEKGMLMLVTAPHCTPYRSAEKPGYYKSHEELGELQFPIYSLEGVSQAGRVALYRKGDYMRVVAADPDVLDNLKLVARDNMASVAEKGYRASYCNNGFERDSQVSWDAVLELR